MDKNKKATILIILEDCSYRDLNELKEYTRNSIKNYECIFLTENTIGDAYKIRVDIERIELRAILQPTNYEILMDAIGINLRNGYRTAKRKIREEITLK